MGLAIVRSIVEAHGGTIIGENAPDRGARMIVRRPAAAARSKKRRRHERIADAQANEVCLWLTIPSVLTSMQYLLASEGFKVRPFNKAEDFLEHVGTHPVPVVVTDIWMDRSDWPGSAGTTLCDFAAHSRHCHHCARRSGRTRHGHGHWAGRIFHETFR